MTELRQHAVEIEHDRKGLALEPAAPALRYAEQHLFERRSVIQDHEVIAEALRQARGRIALSDAKGVPGLEESSGAILRVGHQVATRESLDLKVGRGRGWILSPSGCINANWGRKLPSAGNDAIAVLNESAIS